MKLWYTKLTMILPCPCSEGQSSENAPHLWHYVIMISLCLLLLFFSFSVRLAQSRVATQSLNRTITIMNQPKGEFSLQIFSSKAPFSPHYDKLLSPQDAARQLGAADQKCLFCPFIMTRITVSSVFFNGERISGQD